MVAHCNERNPPLRGGVLIANSACSPSHQASFCRHHIPTPRRLCQRQTGPVSPISWACRFPHRAGKGQPSLARFLALPQGSERPIGALPLCTICIGAKLLYRFGGVIRGHSVVGGRSGCWRSPPPFSSDKARCSGLGAAPQLGRLGFLRGRMGFSLSLSISQNSAPIPPSLAPSLEKGLFRKSMALIPAAALPPKGRGSSAPAVPAFQFSRWGCGAQGQR